MRREEPGLYTGAWRQVEGSEKRGSRRRAPLGRPLPHGELRLELSCIQFEKSIAGLDALSGRDQHSRHDAREWGPDPDVLGAGFN